MTDVRFYFANKRVGPLFSRKGKTLATQQREAIRAAAKDLAKEIKSQGEDDMTSAGRFGQRWKDAFQVSVTEGGGSVRIEATMSIFYWRVFQYGATINGKPLLWIPLSFASDAQGKRASDYPGQLFRVDRVGKAPLLLTPGKPAQPKYFGKESVTIPKRAFAPGTRLGSLWTEAFVRVINRVREEILTAGR